MQRRDFIKLAGASVALLPFSPVAFSGEPEKWGSYLLKYKVDLPAGGKRVRLWLPLPDTNDTSHQFSQGSVWSGNADVARFGLVPGTAAPVFYAEWNGSSSSPRQVLVTSAVKTAERVANLHHYRDRGKAVLPSEVRRFLQPSRRIPVNGIVEKTAMSIVREAGARTQLQKALAVYNWVVDNGYRDPSVPGCGQGNIQAMLESGKLGGKSMDTSSLFVGLARAAGIPARGQYGIRIDESEIHKSMGKFGDVSEAQHCHAEFYLAGLGWVAVDPADVHQLILDTGLAKNDPGVVVLKERFFGSWEKNWVAFNHVTDVSLGKDSAAGVLPFFTYPHAEIDGKPQDSLNAAGFSYKISSAEMVGTGAKL